MDLLLLAAAAIVAAASKYLVTVGGRHVLNPAAAGAFVVGLTGLSGGVWWVANPVLLPLVAVTGLLVALRVGAVLPALVLVAGGALLESAASVVQGAEPLPALTVALTSTPLVFLAGFMFTEPVTLPPRTGQRMLEAGLIAVLLAVPYVLPFRVATFGPSPELALLLGNVLAVLLARPVAAQLRFAGRRPLTASATEYAFTPDSPVRHRAGQYLELQLPHRGADRRGIRRTLTIVSPPGDPALRVAVRTREPMSTFKQALDVLPLGSPVRAVTVSGAFTLPDDRRRPCCSWRAASASPPSSASCRRSARRRRRRAARDVLLVDRVADRGGPALPGRARRRAASACSSSARTPVRSAAVPEHWHVTQRFDAAALAGVLPEPRRRTPTSPGPPAFIARARPCSAPPACAASAPTPSPATEYARPVSGSGGRRSRPSGSRAHRVFVLVHVLLGIAGLVPGLAGPWGDPTPFGDVTSVYRFWIDYWHQNGQLVGIDPPWVYPLLALVPMLAVSVAGDAAYGPAWVLLVTLLDVGALVLVARAPRLAWWWVLFTACLGPVAIGRIDAVALPIAIAGVLLIGSRPALAVGAAVDRDLDQGAGRPRSSPRCSSPGKRTAAVITGVAFTSAAVIGGAVALGAGRNVFSFVDRADRPRAAGRGAGDRPLADRRAAGGAGRLRLLRPGHPHLPGGRRGVDADARGDDGGARRRRADRARARAARAAARRPRRGRRRAHRIRPGRRVPRAEQGRLAAVPHLVRRAGPARPPRRPAGSASRRSSCRSWPCSPSWSTRGATRSS